MSSLTEFISSKPVFSMHDLPSHLRKVIHLPQMLARLQKSGRLRRIRRGAYAVIPPGVSPHEHVIDPFLIASVITQPYAIGFYSSLSMRGLAESAANTIYVLSRTRFSSFTFDEMEYVPVVTRRFFGIETVYREGLPLKVTDLERTLLDSLRYPSYSGGLDELLRTLEGIQRSDLLAMIFDHVVEHSSLPDWKAFRAKHEDRRAELDQLATHGLIATANGHSLFLTLLGLAFCPHPKAASELSNVKKVYAVLRDKYKSETGKAARSEKEASALGIDTFAFQRAALALVPMSVGVDFGGILISGAPLSFGIQEPILDFTSADQLLAQRLSTFTPPSHLSLHKAPVVSIRYERMLDHLKEFGEEALYAKAGFLLRFFESRWKPPQDVFRKLARHLGRNKNYFPHGLKKGTGRMIPQWNLIVPSHIHSRYLAARGTGKGDASAAV